MSIPIGQLVVLDTNVLVDVLRNNKNGQFIESEYQLTSRAERPLFSTVTEGELLGLVKRWNWGKARMDSLHELLDQLVRVDAGLPDIVEAYADLYAQSYATGNGTGENDLWIAATASATNSVLLTRDTDFDWMFDASLVNVERIEVDNE